MMESEVVGNNHDNLRQFLAGIGLDGSFNDKLGGYSSAGKAVVETQKGSFFVKWASDEFSREALMREILVYKTVGSNSPNFMPELVAFDKDPNNPKLVVEFIKAPKISIEPKTLDKIKQQLKLVWELRPTGLPVLDEDFENYWELLEKEPRRLSGLNLREEYRWILNPKLMSELSCLENRFIEARKKRELVLVHGDLREDNIIITNEGRVLFVDWGSAGLGDKELDYAFLLVGLGINHLIKPWDYFSDGGGLELAIHVGGYFMANAGLPIIPNAPKVREIQHAQLLVALDWIKRELN